MAEAGEETDRLRIAKLLILKQFVHLVKSVLHEFNSLFWFKFLLHLYYFWREEQINAFTAKSDGPVNLPRWHKAQGPQACFLFQLDAGAPGGVIARFQLARWRLDHVFLQSDTILLYQCDMTTVIRQDANPARVLHHLAVSLVAVVELDGARANGEDGALKSDRGIEPGFQWAPFQ